MQCRDVYNLLPEYSAEALSQRQMAKVRAHLDACAACRAEAVSLAVVLRLVEAHATVAPPAGLWHSVCERLEADRARDGRSASGTRHPFGPWSLIPGVWRLAGGAVLATGLAVALWNTAGPFGPHRNPTAPGGEWAHVTDPELVAAVQQHSLASTGQFFADRAGLESLVQLVRQERGERKAR